MRKGKSRKDHSVVKDVVLALKCESQYNAFFSGPLKKNLLKISIDKFSGTYCVWEI